MKKKVRVHTSTVYTVTIFVILICAAVGALAIKVDSFMKWIPMVGLVVSCCGYIRWIDCGENEICSTRCFFVRRKIDVKRITSIQFVSFQQKYSTYQYFVICIDGHRPFDCGKNKLDFIFPQFFFLSPKVLSVRLLKNQCAEYIEEISQMYDSVTVDEMFVQMQRQWANKSDE